MSTKQYFWIAVVAIVVLLGAFSTVRAATILFPTGGGTGIQTVPSYGQLLVGNSSGTYTLTATSSLGLPFPFTTTTNYGATANATGTPLWLQAGLQASSTSYLSTTNITGNATIGDATSDSLTLNASTITLGANQYNITRSMGTAPAGLSEVLNYNIDFTGDAGGTTEVFGRHMEISPTGANPIADVRNAYEGIIHDGSGQITLAYNQHDFIIMDGAGGCTDCIGFFQHMNSRAGAYINRAGNFVAGTSVLTNGGAIGTIKGFQTSDIGNTTQVGNAYSFFAGDTNATSTVAAFYSETTAGTGKYAFKGNGDAMNVFRGNTRIGSQADPVNTLDVTGTGTFTAGLGVATTTTLANSLVTIHGSSGATTTLSRGDNGNTTGEPLGTLAWWSNDATANGSGFKTYIRGMTENAGGTIYGLAFGTSNVGEPTDKLTISGAGVLTVSALGTGAVSASSGVLSAGTLSVANGGTGLTSCTNNYVVTGGATFNCESTLQYDGSQITQTVSSAGLTSFAVFNNTSTDATAGNRIIIRTTGDGTTSGDALVNYLVDSAGGAQQWATGVDGSGDFYAIDNTNQIGANPEFVISTAGNIGFGTTTPDARLYIDTSGATSTVTLNRNDTGVLADDGIGSFSFNGNDTQLTTNFTFAQIRAISHQAVSTDAAAGNLVFSTTGTTVAGLPVERMRIDYRGYVGIGTTSPQYLFSVASPATDTNIRQLYDSDANCLENPETTGITVTCSSDEKLKENIRDSEGSAVEYLNDFRIRDYTVKASGETVTGVVAQEVKETHPELVKDIAPEWTEEVVLPTGEVTTVTKTGEVTLGVEIPSTWELIKAIQELDARVTALEAEKKIVAADSTTKGAAGGVAAMLGLGAAAWLVARKRDEV